jgi:hypothetical protein
VSFILSVNHPECRKRAKYAVCHNAECRYAECRYAERLGAKSSFIGLIWLQTVAPKNDG